LSLFLGKPATFKLVNDVDWVPTLNLNLEESMASKSLDVVDLTVDSADEEVVSSSVFSQANIASSLGYLCLLVCRKVPGPKSIL